MNSLLRYLPRTPELTRHPRPTERPTAAPVPTVTLHRHVFDTANGGEVDMRHGLWIIRCACGSGRLFGSW
jgi:hypothetical protein